MITTMTCMHQFFQFMPFRTCFVNHVNAIINFLFFFIICSFFQKCCNLFAQVTFLCHFSPFLAIFKHVVLKGVTTRLM